MLSLRKTTQEEKHTVNKKTALLLIAVMILTSTSVITIAELLYRKDIQSTLEIRSVGDIGVYEADGITPCTYMDFGKQDPLDISSHEVIVKNEANQDLWLSIENTMAQASSKLTGRYKNGDGTNFITPTKLPRNGQLTVIIEVWGLEGISAGTYDFTLSFVAASTSTG